MPLCKLPTMDRLVQCFKITIFWGRYKSPPSVNSLSTDLFQVTPVYGFHVAGGVHDPPSTFSQGLLLSQIKGVINLLNEVAIRTLHCTPLEEYNELIQLLQTVCLRRKGQKPYMNLAPVYTSVYIVSRESAVLDLNYVSVTVPILAAHFSWATLLNCIMCS